MSTSSFSSLPVDIQWNIFARVPKRSYPILSCVSKNFRRLIRSPEIHKIRSGLGKDSLYICFKDKTNNSKWKWFTLRRAENNEERENQFVSVDLVFPFPCHRFERRPSVIAIGPVIFCICGSMLLSTCMWIFDSRTGKVRRGPSSTVDRLTEAAGLVGSKIYTIGLYPRDEIHVESYDLKTQTWEMAPDPERFMYSSYETVSLDRKICTLPLPNSVAADCYDTRDGSWESLELPEDKWWRTGVCVINNVLYIYYARFGLMWYDSELRLWRLVLGLKHLKKVQSVGLAEYYGKLAVLWTELGGGSGETKEIWCRKIALEKSEVGVHGTPEASQLLGSVPSGYKLKHCLSVSD